MNKEEFLEVSHDLIEKLGFHDAAIWNLNFVWHSHQQPIFGLKACTSDTAVLVAIMSVTIHEDERDVFKQCGFPFEIDVVFLDVWKASTSFTYCPTFHESIDHWDIVVAEKTKPAPDQSPATSKVTGLTHRIRMNSGSVVQINCRSLYIRPHSSRLE